MASTPNRGVVIISIDTEQFWGYHDLLSEAGFEARFPNAPQAHALLLNRICAAGVSATWFVVGGLAVGSGLGAQDRPLWQCRRFLELLRDADPAQEIGLHGGLTHLIWTDRRTNREIAHRELREGIAALARLGTAPRSFSYPRNGEAYHDLLPRYGIHCFRGAPPTLSWRLGRTIPGAILRASDELRCATPPLVWPRMYSPGLWTLPASMFLYPIRPVRTGLIGLRSRLKRFISGVEAAARNHKVFHFCFHPENLAESPHGFPLLDEILEILVQARNRGDIEVMTVSDVIARVDRRQQHVLREHHNCAQLSETPRSF